MKKVFSLIVALSLIIFILTSCGLSSESKLYTAKGDAAFQNRDYKAAYEHYTDAAASGKATDRVTALTEILDAYLSASSELDEGNFIDAQKIMDGLNYDPNGFPPINEDINELNKKINEHTKNYNTVENTLKVLTLAIDDRNLESAYKYISDIEGKPMTDEQKEEFTYQKSRIDRISLNLKDDVDDENVPEVSETPTVSSTENNNENVSTKFYRVRKSWDDIKSQVGAFTLYENAVKAAKENPEYKVFDDNGNVLYP